MMMHAAFVSILSLCTVAFAAPVTWGSGSLNSRSHPVSRAFTGIEICGPPGRGDVQPGCLANPLRFTLTNNVLTAAPTGAQPANTECDHSLELQVLKQALLANGACAALDKILSAGGVPVDQKKVLMLPILTAINAQGNSVFLDKSVNAEKRLVVQHALGDNVNRPASAALTAVKAYLANTQIRAATTALATKLDALTVTMVTNAETQANAAINAKKAATSRQQKAKGTSLTNVQTAKDQFKPATGGVSTAWQTVLTYAGRQP